MNMPEIGYGNFRKKWLRKATVYSFRNCSMILPVAETLIEQHYQFDPHINPKQGLKNLIPGLETPIQVVHNGFDIDFWKNQGKKRQSLSFISVATGTSNSSRAIVKGYDFIEKLAGNHANWEFTLVGDPAYQSPHSNVKVLGKMNPTELRHLYNQHQFYLQLSTSEGFPNALGEAMACGCIPIGSAVGAIPEIIGDTGIVLFEKDYSLLDLEVNKLLQKNLDSFSLEASKRISSDFTFEKRKKQLLHFLDLT